MANTTKTMRISFETDKHGKPLAYRHSISQMRKFRISLEHARFLIATGQGFDSSAGNAPVPQEVQ